MQVPQLNWFVKLSWDLPFLLSFITEIRSSRERIFIFLLRTLLRLNGQIYAQSTVAYLLPEPITVNEGAKGTQRRLRVACNPVQERVFHERMYVGVYNIFSYNSGGRLKGLYCRFTTENPGLWSGRGVVFF